MDERPIIERLNEMGRTDKTTNEELSEIILKLAVIANHEREVNAIPPREELEKMYKFSEEFEIRMKKLFSYVMNQ